MNKIDEFVELIEFFIKNLKIEKILLNNFKAIFFSCVFVSFNSIFTSKLNPHFAKKKN